MPEQTPALLALEDGTTWPGIALGAVGERTGEVVFNTAMTGYQEVLTDPSYYGQIVVMTAPHIGNTGINADDEESHKPWLSGFVVRAASSRVSNWRSTEPLDGYLKRHHIVGSGRRDEQLTERDAKHPSFGEDSCEDREGGAERQFCYLAKGLSAVGVNVEAVCMRGGPNMARLVESGAIVESFSDLSSYSPRVWWRLYRRIRRSRVDIVQTWLCQMDVIGGFAARCAGIPWILSERTSALAYPSSATAVAWITACS